MPHLRRQNHEGSRDPRYAQHQGRSGGAPGDQGTAHQHYTESGVQFGLETTRYFISAFVRSNATIKLHLDTLSADYEIFRILKTFQLLICRWLQIIIKKHRVFCDLRVTCQDFTI